MNNNSSIIDRKVSNTIVWILAFSPFIGVLIQAFISNLLDINFNTLWVVTFSINIFLATYDIKYLTSIQRHSTYLGNPMLVPLYLFRRARLLDHPLDYPLVWCLSSSIVLLTPGWKITALLS
jgi:hypothetical protein